MLGRRSVKPLLLASIAAVAYYAYSKMTEEQRRNITGTIRQQGKDLWSKISPAIRGRVESSLS